MKTLKYCLCLFGMLFFTSAASGQNDYATIVVYRPSMFAGSIVKAALYINDVKVCDLKNGGTFEYKLYNTGRTSVLVRGNGFYHSDEVLLEAIKGKKHYVMLRSIASGYSLTETDKIEKKGKLSRNKVEYGSDINAVSNATQSDAQRTSWTAASLKGHWKENGISGIEGIFETVGNGLQLELALVEEENAYNLVYLSGASGSAWKEGDLKGTLKKTAAKDIYKTSYYTLDKDLVDNVIITFETENLMKIFTESTVEGSTYLKIYPTYEESVSGSTSDWSNAGTGFFIDKTGYVVTNYHVIEDKNSFQVGVSRNGKITSHTAEIISSDKQNDLAILKITDVSFQPLKALNYNFNTSTKDVGSEVFALGYPMTNLMGEEIKFTDGKISAKSGFQGDITNYQITVPIQPGNSGGPLFDTEGNLVGITAAKLLSNLADNVNYAIKTSYLKLLIDATSENMELPNNTILASKPLTEQIKILSEYVVLVKVK